jgi:hypothetical protein
VIEEQPLGNRPVERHAPAVEHDNPRARALDRRRVVRDQHKRGPRLHLLADPRQALPLERLVPHGEDLVDQQHVRVQVGDDRKAQPQVHAGRIRLHRHVDEVTELGELDDAIDTLLDLLAGEAVQRAVQVDVLAARELRAEAGAQLEQRHHAPAALGPP